MSSGGQERSDPGMNSGMSFELSEDQALIRKSVAELAGKFDDHYWMEKDQAHEFPQEFYDAIAKGGWLGMTIPEEYGGHGLGITEATLLLEEIARSGAAMNGASAVHLSIFGMQPVVKHGSDELKAATLPRIVNGALQVCFGVTEPGAGLDTSRITTFAKREGDKYRINGRKVWISKALESEKILLLTRTTPYDEVNKMTFENAIRWYHWDPFTHITREQATVGALRKAAEGHDVSIQALSKHEHGGASFQDFATFAYESARQQYGQQAADVVRDAFRAHHVEITG